MSLPHRFFNGRFVPVNTFVSGFCLPGAPRADQKRPGQLLAPQWKGETAACFGFFQTNSKKFFKKRKKPPISYFGRTTKSLPPCYNLLVYYAAAAKTGAAHSKIACKERIKKATSTKTSCHTPCSTAAFRARPLKTARSPGAAFSAPEGFAFDFEMDQEKNMEKEKETEI